VTVILYLALAGWLVVMSIYDLRTRQVPNWLTIPPLLTILAWQLAHRQWQILLPLPLIFSLWHLYILGGADAKVLATLFALWPGNDFLIFFCVGYAIVALPVLLLRRRRSQGSRGEGETGRGGDRENSPRPLVSPSPGLLRSLAMLHLPTEEELEAHGTPAIPMYSLVALVYALLLLVRSPA